MTRQGEETRARLIRAAVTLFQSQGYHATGVAAILTHAGVPKGSMYHHFPDGKQELTLAAVDWLTQEMIARFTRAADGRVAADRQVLRLFADTAAWVDAHDFTQGALLSMLAQEVDPADVALRTRIAAAYRQITEELARALEAGGAAQPEELATTALAALDGGIARARAQRSTVGLHRAGEILAAVARP